MECLRSKSVFWGLTVLLLFVIVSAARSGAADLLSVFVRSEMDTWQGGAVKPQPADLDSVSRALTLATVLAPGNPAHPEDRARLALLRATMPDIGDAEKQALLKQGLQQIHRAISLRPASAYSWAILLLLKRESAEYDAEFRLGLERAVTLGPWEPEVQPIVAEVGLSAWPSLSAAEREMVRNNFVRGMRHQPEVMIELAQSHRDACNAGTGKLPEGCVR